MEQRRARGGTLILGGGFAGAYVARLLGSRGSTIVSPDNFMLYTPLLPEAASGMLEPRHVVVPLRQMCPQAELILGSARDLDESRREVAVDSLGGELTIGYEQLVVALGAVARVSPVPGLTEHGLGFKDVADAIGLRNHVLRELEAAESELDPGAMRRHLTFVFVGGGYAGVEALAELSDLVADASRLYPRVRRSSPRWILVEAAEEILSEIPPGLGRYAAEQLTGRGVEIRTLTTLVSVEELAVTLSTGDRIETNTLVWTAGIRPNSLPERWGLPVDGRNRVVTDPYLRVSGHPGVWALGDCAAVPNDATPGRVDPPTCQHALRQARQLARNLAGTEERYAYRMLGQVATLGRYKGIADVLGIRLHGFPGWFVTRTYHLYQLPLFGRKLRVVTDWTTSLLFRRDVVELSGLGRPRRLDE